MPGGVQLLPMTGGRDRARLQPARQSQELKLPRDVYAGIFLGKITKWSDPKLKAANPGRRRCPTWTSRWCAARTPAARRSCSPAPERHQRGVEARARARARRSTGRRATSSWPRPRTTASPPPSSRRPGAIGYIEYAFAKFAKLEMAQLQNKAGQFVAPGGEGGPAALAGVAAAGQPARVDPRPGGPQVVPDRHLHLDALLQGEQGPEEGGGAPPAGRVLPDRRPEDERARWATSRCRSNVVAAVRKAAGEHPVSPGPRAPPG